MEKLDAAQLDQLKEIGAHLRQVRQEQSRSLEEIATKTCIRLPLLQALEAGHGQVLPEPVFVQGFIRRYADLLGLDGTSLSRTFFVNRGMVVNPDLPIKTVAEPQYKSVPTVPTFAKPKAVTRLPEVTGEGEGRSLFQSKGAYAVYALLSVLALGGIVHSFFSSDSPSADSPSAKVSSSIPTSPKASSPAIAVVPSAKPASPSPIDQALTPASPVAIDSPSVQPSALAAGTAIGNEPVSVAVHLTDAAWMQVLVDGQLDYEGILPKGTERNWSAKRQITVVSGNAGAVSISANSGASKPMGKLGDVKELTVTAKN